MAAQSPTVSVLVLAFRRNEFVVGAADSVLAQGGSPTGREVIVVSQGLSSETLAELRRREVRLLFPEAAEQGTWVAEAAETARGEVVAFLDDDDLFLPGKLIALQESFGTEPRLGYWQHASRIFGQSPRSVGADGRFGGCHGGEQGWPALTPPSILPRDLWSAWAAGAGYNSSRVAVRREVLLRSAPWLSAVEGGVASFLLYAALGMGLHARWDPREFSQFRRHPQNTTGVGDRSLTGRWAQRMAMASRVARDGGALEAMFRGLGGSPTLLAPVHAAVARSRLRLAVADPTAPRTEVVRQAIQVLSASSRGMAVGLGGDLAWAGARVLAPGIIRDRVARFVPESPVRS